MEGSRASRSDLMKVKSGSRIPLRDRRESLVVSWYLSTVACVTELRAAPVLTRKISGLSPIIARIPIGSRNKRSMSSDITRCRGLHSAASVGSAAPVKAEAMMMQQNDLGIARMEHPSCRYHDTI